MGEETIWKLDIQSGNSQATLKSFENSLNMAKDRINQVVGAGQNFEKLSSFQIKAAEAAKKLEVAQAQAALALKKAQDAASGGKVSAEQLALMQAKAGLAAEQITAKENALGAAMAKVQGETNRLQTAMAEEAAKSKELGNVFTFLKEKAESAASGMSAGFKGLQGVILGVSEQVSSFAGNIRSNMESARTEIIETEVASRQASGGISSGFKGASGGLLDFASKAGMAFMGIQGLIQGAIQLGGALLGPIASAESLGISFTTLMGGAKQAADEIKELNHFADVTPFEPEPVQQYAAQLIGMGIDAKQTIPIMTSLGDALFGIGHGTEAEMKSVVDQIGKIRVAGVMTWGDISQLQTHGIDVLDAMSRATGKTKEALRDMAGSGGIPAKDAIDALTKGIEMNPLYKGGMAKQSASLSGILSTMTGYLKTALNSFLGLKDGMVVTGGIVDRVKGLFQGLATAVSSEAFQGFVSGAGAALGAILGVIGNVLTWLTTPLRVVVDFFKSPAFTSFASGIGGKIADIFGRIGAVINNDLKPPLEKVVGFFSSGFSNFASGVGKKTADIFSTIGSFLESKLRPPLQAVMGYLESDAFKTFAKDTGQKIIDVFATMGNFLETKVNPPLKAFGDYVQTKIVPVLQTWGHNIQVYALDKLSDLKRFIDTQVMPKISDFWNFIQTKIVPVLQAWGNNIKVWVLDKLSDLKTFIDTNVMPKIFEFWNFIQTRIVPTLQTWGQNIKVWVLDKLSDLKTFIDTQVMPKISDFWNFIQTKIVPVLQDWGNNIKIWVLDKLSDLKTFIETQVMPKISNFWSFIQTYIVPTLQTWGQNIQTYVINKLLDLKTFIETEVIPKLQTLWSWIQTNIIPIFTHWGEHVQTAQNKLSDLKVFIDTQVMPALFAIWSWIKANVIPVFQSLGNIITNDVMPPFHDIWDSIQNRLLPSLNRLWNLIGPPLQTTFGLLALLVGGHVTNSFQGLKNVLDIVGIGVKFALGQFNSMINGLSQVADMVSWVIEQYKKLNEVERNIGGGIAGALGIPKGPAPKKFASGVENFGGGLAYVHANEILVNLPKGTSVWNPAKTAQFMQSLKIPTPSFTMSTPALSGSSSNGGNDQIVGLLAGILDALQKQTKGSNVTLNNTMQSGDVNASKLISAIESVLGHGYESVARGAF